MPPMTPGMGTSFSVWMGCIVSRAANGEPAQAMAVKAERCILTEVITCATLDSDIHTKAPDWSRATSRFVAAYVVLSELRTRSKKLAFSGEKPLERMRSVGNRDPKRS